MLSKSASSAVVEQQDNIAISVQGVSKVYPVYDAPKDRLKQSLFSPIRKMLGKTPKLYHREFHALDDISIDIRKGETVGIVGRNGSGKSTLLQVICGTLHPSGGMVETHGRVAALLELGSGFNPEFTGRENVHMNAAILGLKPEEIKAKFEDIVAFADIGEFIEQPVKTYSSGMLVRLAFAVIAHVDADILIVDEALSVGDAVFTQKCMRWLRAFQKKGTVLFVSHDTSSVIALCDRAVWLHHGKVMRQGPSKDISEAYLRYTLQEISGEELELEEIKSEQKNEGSETKNPEKGILDYESQVIVEGNMSNARGWKTGKAEILSVEFKNKTDPTKNFFEGGEEVCVKVRAKAHEPLDAPIIGFLIRDRLGQDLFGENTLPFTDLSPTPVPEGHELEAQFVFRLPMLPNGDYELMSSVANGNLQDNAQHHWLHDALIFKVSSSKVRYGLVGVPFRHVSMRVINE